MNFLSEQMDRLEIVGVRPVELAGFSTVIHAGTGRGRGGEATSSPWGLYFLERYLG